MSLKIKAVQLVQATLNWLSILTWAAALAAPFIHFTMITAMIWKPTITVITGLLLFFTNHSVHNNHGDHNDHMETSLNVTAFPKTPHENSKIKLLLSN